MVSEERLALNRVDWLLAGYLAFVSIVVIVRGEVLSANSLGVLAMNAQYGLLLFLFSRLRRTDAVGRFIHDCYPMLFLIPFYGMFSLINPPVGDASVLANDAIVQGWEEALFGMQVSYEWIRSAPSVFWSWVLHLAYFSYYPLVSVPIVVWFLGREANARRIVFPMMVSFVMCYVVFILWPVAGPNYTFDHPTGPVREVWSARLVYNLLDGSSSFGTAFPSSHVAATLAATIGHWVYERKIAYWTVLPCILLIVGTVYCQMHYGVDALAGIVFGIIGFEVGRRIQDRSVAHVPIAGG